MTHGTFANSANEHVKDTLPTLRSGAAARHQPSVSYRCSIEMKAKYGIRATVSSTQNLTETAIYAINEHQ